MVHNKITNMGSRLEDMNKEVKEKISDTQARLECLESIVEVIKG